MTRHIKVRQLKINKTFNNVTPLNWSYLVSKAIGWSLSNATNGVIVRGCGMDMGFHLINTLIQNTLRQRLRNQARMVIINQLLTPSGVRGCLMHH
jgi:hypothetical protein